MRVMVTSLPLTMLLELERALIIVAMIKWCSQEHTVGSWTSLKTVDKLLLNFSHWPFGLLGITASHKHLQYYECAVGNVLSV